MVEPSRRTAEEPKMSNITAAATQAAEIETILARVDAAGGWGAASQADINRFGELEQARTAVQDVTEAHEQAHRENERRWAVAQAEALGLGMFSEDTDAIVDLARTYRRMWRLAREVGPHSAEGSRRVSQASAAYRELMNEYGIAVEGGYDVLTLVKC